MLVHGQIWKVVCNKKKKKEFGNLYSASQTWQTADFIGLTPPKTSPKLWEASFSFLLKAAFRLLDLFRPLGSKCRSPGQPNALCLRVSKLDQMLFPLFLTVAAHALLTTSLFQYGGGKLGSASLWLLAPAWCPASCKAHAGCQHSTQHFPGGLLSCLSHSGKQHTAGWSGDHAIQGEHSLCMPQASSRVPFYAACLCHRSGGYLTSLIALPGVSLISIQQPPDFLTAPHSDKAANTVRQGWTPKQPEQVPNQHLSSSPSDTYINTAQCF